MRHLRCSRFLFLFIYLTIYVLAVENKWLQALQPLSKNQIYFWPGRFILTKETNMANLHVRSNSLPSNPHPIINDVEDRLFRLKSSEGTSTSATSVCAKLAHLRDLHDGINNLIHMSSFQQGLSYENSEKWAYNLLEESLALVDLCGLVREVLILTKESVQELQSSIRRNRGETATADDINAYMSSRKKIDKIVSKFIKNFKSLDKKTAAFLVKDSDLKAIAEMVNETEAFDLSVLKSVLIVMSGANGRSKKRSWSLLSKFTKEREAEDLCSLKAYEMTIKELEDGLEAFFRSLVETRVSLLNALNH